MIGTTRRPALSGREWTRIVVMGVFLALTSFFAFFYDAASAPGDGGGPAVVTDETPVPELDEEILALVKDASRTDRLMMEEAPLAHLLEKSLLVVPSVAAKLNMPEQPIPIAKLRSDPDRYRGRYLWYKGTLEWLSRGRPGHPVRGYRIHEGRLKTPGGEPVLFYFSEEPPEGLKVGDWVRVEGFSLKLRDTNLPVKIDMAPVLVGPEIFKAYPDWKAVEKLDAAVLARVKDGVLVDGRLVDEQDVRKMLDRSQDVPLWHLASYAMHRERTMTPQERQAFTPFVHKDQWRAIELGKVAKGTPYRLLGTFQIARTMRAKPNPLGIEHWTEVWIQCRDLGGRTIPIWIPEKLDPSWRRNMSVWANAYFFKRYVYQAEYWRKIRRGDREVRAKVREDRYAPLFVAATIHRIELSEGLLTNQITLLFAAIALVVTVVFLVSALRDARRSRKFENERIERRRRLRRKLEASRR